MGSSGSRDVSDKPVVLIIGGGSGGIAVAKELDKTKLFNVVLLDRKDYFLHNVASLRSAVVPNWANNVLIPYHALLQNGLVLKADVESVSKQGIKVNGREDLIKFDYLVLATGSSYAFPGKIAETEAEAAHAKYAKFYDLVKQSTKILIVGAGATGIELAGEISTVYPEKSLTLLSSSEQLIPQPTSLSDKFRNRLKNELEALNIKLILGDKLSALEVENQKEEEEEAKAGGASTSIFSKAVVGKRTVKTDKGQSLDVDLVLFCTGNKINSKVYEEDFASSLDARKRIKTNEYLQVEGCKNIFAVGDCRAGNSGQAYHAGLEAAVAAKNIIALEKKKSPSSTYVYDDTKAAILIPLGSSKGVAEIGGSMLGHKLTSMIKSKNLMVDRTWGMLNLKPASSDRSELNPSLEDNKAKNLAAAVGIDANEAKKLWSSGGYPRASFENEVEHT